MRRTTFISIATFIFSLVSLCHLIRAVLNWDLIISGWNFPVWISYLAFLILAFMAINGITILKRK